MGLKMLRSVGIILCGGVGTLYFSSNTMACSVCFSPVENDPMNIALRASILCLFGVILVVLLLFAKFFLNIRKREKLSLKDN